jgi:acetate kinase
VFCYRVRKYIGAYFVTCRPDAVLFTGGIGEISPVIRARICEGLEAIGLRVDDAKNDALAGGRIGEFSADDATLKAYVVPTNEELLIARDTYRAIHGTSNA